MVTTAPASPGTTVRPDVADVADVADCHDDRVSGYALHATDGDPARVATILPGSGYTAMGPLLWFARAALCDQGWTVRVLEWTAKPTFDSARLAYARVLDGADAPDEGLPHLVVAKSLGTLAMPLAARLGLPGVWLTPLLTSEDAPEMRSAVAHLGGDHLLVGGSADPHWDGALAASSAADVLEVGNADHNLETPKDRAESLLILDEVAWEIEEFAGLFGPR